MKRKKQEKTWNSKVSNKMKLHFDKRRSEALAEIIVNPESVIKHKFFPFLSFTIRAFRYSKLKNFKKKFESYTKEDLFKKRPIKYACYSDSYIFSYYNELLAKAYEKKLEEYSLNEVVIAYRSIKRDSHSGKCNIDFAAEAFLDIKNRKDCFCIGLDIKSFFDRLDHKILKQNLKYVLNTDSLSDDWYQVFKVLTKFHFIELDELLELLDKKKKDLWIEGKGFEEICSPQEFRELIKTYPHIIKRNPEINSKIRPKVERGIPQGTNISGTLANIYMIEFDKKLYKYLMERNGYYRRYSDDILITVDNKQIAEETIIFIKELLQNIVKLNLSEEKTVSCSFKNLICTSEPIAIKQEVDKENSLQYLGFCYDGENVRIRNSTIGKFWKDAKPHIKNMIISASQNNAKVPLRKIYALYSHLKNRKSKTSYSGNFYEYIRKADKLFKEKYGFKNESKIKHQVRNFWKLLHEYIADVEAKIIANATDLPRNEIKYS